VAGHRNRPGMTAFCVIQRIGILLDAMTIYD
jgi:hypothetical protein